MSVIEQLGNSLTYARESVCDFVENQPLLFIIILIIGIRSIIYHILRSKLRDKYVVPYEWEGNIDNSKFYIKYYKKVQYLNIIGSILAIGLLIVYLITKNKILGTVFAVGIGAVLITFQTFTVSLFTYFLLINNYKIGDTVRVGADKVQGEILYIKMLYVGIAGKNDFGESTGKFYLIPNYQIRTNTITKVDLALNHYGKHSVTVIYKPNNFSVDFETFNKKLTEFLDKLLPIRGATQVAYYKSYMGVRYKIDYDYNKDGDVSIRIGFVEKRTVAIKIKEQIISFVEKMKKVD